MTYANALRADNTMFLSERNFIPNNASYASFDLTESIESTKRRTEELLGASPRRVDSGSFVIDAKSSPSLAQRMHSVPFVIDTRSSAALQIFKAIQVLYLSQNLRDRQIAQRLTSLYRDALEEGEKMHTDSIGQLSRFFLNNRDVGVPKITLTPDGTLRARWIHDAGNFIAIEFTGKPLARVVTEMPRNNETAKYFFSESIENVVSNARAIGASFA